MLGSRSVSRSGSSHGFDLRVVRRPGISSRTSSRQGSPTLFRRHGESAQRRYNRARRADVAHHRARGRGALRRPSTAASTRALPRRLAAHSAPTQNCGISGLVVDRCHRDAPGARVRLQAGAVVRRRQRWHPVPRHRWEHRAGARWQPSRALPGSRRPGRAHLGVGGSAPWIAPRTGLAKPSAFRATPTAAQRSRSFLW